MQHEDQVPVARHLPLTMAAPVILVVFGVVILASILLPKCRMWWISRSIPGPRGYPLIGNILAYQGDEYNAFDVTIDLCKTYGKFFRIWFGTKLVVFVNDPVDIQQVIGNPKVINKDAMFTKVVEPFIGNGLVTARSETWRRHRKILTPTFHFKILQTYVSVFGRKAKQVCDRLEQFADSGESVDIHKHLSMGALEAICETAIGIKLDAYAVGGSSFFDAMQGGTPLGHERMAKPWLTVDWIFPYTKNGKTTAALHEKIFSFPDSIVKKKQQEHDNNKNNNQLRPEAENGQKKIKTLLELLIESSENEDSAMSEQEIKDQLVTIMGGGFDTSAVTLANICLLFVLNPSVQGKILQEVDDIFNGDLRPAAVEDINRMVYMEAVIKESLRLMPVVPVLLREINEDIVLQSGRTIPAGCSTLTFSYVVHRDPRYFPEPDRFLPERWLPDATGTATKARHPYAYLPFAAGLRNCIGQKYAMLQIKSVASSLFRRFKVSHVLVEEDLKRLGASLILQVYKGHYVKLTRR